MHNSAAISGLNLASQRVLILKTDRFHADTMRQAAEKVVPSASVRNVRRVSEAEEAVAEGPVDLLLTGIGTVEGDVLDFLTANLVGPRSIRKVLVVTGQRDRHSLEVLRTLPIAGVFDPASEDSGQFECALRSVASGGAYWSPSVIARLPRQRLSPQSLCRQLSATEQLVLAMLGDGSDDQVVAERLQLKVSTTKSVRRALHRKLGVQHRGELIRVAVQHGFVRIMPDHVVRPGSATMLAAWQFRRKSRNVYVRL